MSKSEDLIQEVGDFVKMVGEAERDFRAKGPEDLWFSVDGEQQWDRGYRDERERDDRPVISINRLNTFVHQIVNDERKNRPGVKALPGEQNDMEMAEVVEGLLRNIEHVSDIESVLSTAGDLAARCGAAFLRVIPRYCHEDSFNQELIIRAEQNPFAVYFDPNWQSPDYSDARQCVINATVSKAQFKKQYPDSDLTQAYMISDDGDLPPEWICDGVQIREYYRVEETPAKLVSIGDPTGAIITQFWDDVPEGVRKLIESGQVKIVKERMSKKRKIKWSKLNGKEELESTDVPGKFLPVVPVYGQRLVIDGQLHIAGIVRDAKKSQIFENYCASGIAEGLALMFRAPYMIAEGQVEGHEKDWNEANRRNRPYLVYKPVDVAGQLVPAPIRQNVEPAIAGISAARAQNIEAMKAVIGMFNASLGANSPETSGRAIMARQREGDTANFHFPANLALAYRQILRIAAGQLPFYYDAPRMERIVGEDGKRGIVALNQPTTYNGRERSFDMQDVLNNDVLVETGPAYSSAMEEAIDSASRLAQAFPPLIPYVAYDLLRMMPFKGSQEMAQKVKAMIPPEARDEKDKLNPQMLLQQIQQLGQELKHTQAFAQQLFQEKQIDQVKAESTERIKREELQVEREKILAQLKMKQAELTSKEDTKALELEITSQIARMEKDSLTGDQSSA